MTSHPSRWPTPVLALILGLALALPSFAAPGLQVSDDRHSLVYEDDTPFFYLGHMGSRP